ncbi:MAG: hypothetical protein K9H49_10945 [Bacteroidales bacterium]|nr:hypothetical protein [Bacteroidales bacterium]
MKNLHKKYLSHLASEYLQIKKDFELTQEEIINGLKLDSNKRDQVRFGLITPSDPPLQVYADIVNSDENLIQISEQINTTKLKVYKFFLSELWVNKIKIPGYNIDMMFDNPEKLATEIEALFLGIAGYEHLHIIDDKIAKEIPAREYVKEYPKIIRMVDYWFKKIKLFK